MKLPQKRKEHFQQRLGKLLEQLATGIRSYRRYMAAKTPKILGRVQGMCELEKRLDGLKRKNEASADSLLRAYLERYDILQDILRKFADKLKDLADLATEFEKELQRLGEEDTLHGIPDSLKEFHTWVRVVLAALKTQEKHLQLQLRNMQPCNMQFLLEEPIVHLWKLDLELEKQMDDKIALGVANIQLLKKKPLDLQ